MLRNKIFILILFTIGIYDLSAQKYQSGSKIYFPGGLYHNNSGWVNSVGGHIGNVIGYVQGAFDVGGTLSSQVDLQRYKLVNSRLGLGGGIAYKRIATQQLGYEDYSHYKFIDVYAYAKRYLNEKQRRLYLDTKLGLGFQAGTTSYGCYGCDEFTSVVFNFSPGIAVQSGFGFDFATADNSKGGLRFGLSLNIFKGTEESYLANGNPSEPYSTTDVMLGVVPGLLTGLNFYF